VGAHSQLKTIQEQVQCKICGSIIVKQFWCDNGKYFGTYISSSKYIEKEDPLSLMVK